MVSYSPNGPFVPRVPTPFVPKNAQNFVKKAPSSAASVARNVNISPNGPFVPRLPTEFVPKNAQNFTSGGASSANGGALSAIQNAINNQYAEIDRLGGSATVSALVKSLQANSMKPGSPDISGSGGGKMTAAQRFGTPGGGGPINKMFDPLFKMIESQRMAADARYAANQGNIETIYGQLTSARRNDVASTTSAYKALSDAASARSTAVSGNIDASEAARLAANDAVLQSMGLSDVASARMGDVASEQAATAKNVEGLNSSNWQGLLSAMGANAQDVISQDVQSYGYQKARDINALSGDLQNYQQSLDTRQFETQADKGQAKFKFDQAQKAAQASAAAAAARATNAADKAAAARVQELIGSADPLTRALATGNGLGLTTVNVDKIQTAYNSWMIDRGSSPRLAGLSTWSKVTATGDALKYTQGQLNMDEQRVLNDAISNSF
jgi:hypothetical protein